MSHSAKKPPAQTASQLPLRALAGAVLPTLLWILLPAAAATAGPDTRERLSAGSPAWLQAIGQLTVPGLKTEQGRERHHTERCSATLVGPADQPQADLIITAWHCLEAYRDLSRTITFTLLPHSSARREISARPYADGGGMAADWALLRLNDPVPRSEVAAIPLHPGLADAEQTILMAGYSRDAGIGLSGGILSYDPACRITHNTARQGYTNCTAHKGASGGAVIQLGAQGEPLLSGIISEGDGAHDSRFVPVAVMRTAAQRAILRVP